MEYEELRRRYCLPYATWDPVTDEEKEAALYGCHCPQGIGKIFARQDCPIHGAEALLQMHKSKNGVRNEDLRG